MRLKQLLPRLGVDLCIENPCSDSAGWATHSLLLAIRHNVAVAVTGWQFVMMLAAIGALGVAAWPLVLVYAGIAFYALTSTRRSIPLPGIPIAMVVSGAASFIFGGDLTSVLVFAACWQISFATCVAGLVVLHRWLVPAVTIGALGVSAAVGTLLPHWGTELPVAIAITQVLMVVVVRIGITSLFQSAAQVDAEEAEAVRAVGQAQAAHRVNMQIAEHGRVLHDTAINTLGAVANGGYGVSDHHEVRRQCERDLRVLERLRDERHGQTVAPRRLLDLFARSGLPVRRIGLNDHEIRGVEERLERSVVEGIVGCVKEAVTNATKYSGADSVEIQVYADEDHLTITVSDAGVGFDSAATRGYGISQSILARAQTLGLAAEIRSMPMQGTTLTLRAPLRPTAADRDGLDRSLEDVGVVVTRLKRSAGSLWSCGVAVVSIGLTMAVPQKNHLELLTMVVIMIAAWYLTRRQRRDVLSGWALTALAVSACIVFLLSGTATAFGTEQAMTWQALAATGPFVLLLSRGATRTQALVAASAWALVVVAIVLMRIAAFPNAAGIVLVAGVIGLGLGYVWYRFQSAIARLGRRASQEQRRTSAARIAAEAEVAGREANRLWFNAGPGSAMSLLRKIATGEYEPQAETTRRACAEEERYLRQLILVSTELVNLGGALLPTLPVARARKIRYRLRMGGLDAPDESTARLISDAVLHALEATPAGGELSASVFPVAEGVMLTLRGKQLVLGTSDRSFKYGLHVRVSHERLDDDELFQLTIPFATDSRSS